MMRSMDIQQREQASAGPLSIGPINPMSGAGQQKPPSLRMMRDPGMSCETCGQYTGSGCAKFNDYPCKPDQVCDVWEAQGEELSGEEAMEAM